MCSGSGLALTPPVDARPLAGVRLSVPRALIDEWESRIALQLDSPDPRIEACGESSAGIRERSANPSNNGACKAGTCYVAASRRVQLRAGHDGVECALGLRGPVFLRTRGRSHVPAAVASWAHRVWQTIGSEFGQDGGSEHT